MLIELHRKILPNDYSRTCCAICGNDFDRGTVFLTAAGDQGQDLGEMCSVCLEYLTQRKDDAEDPTLGNWPARDWPTLADLEDARRRYPEPMFANAAEMRAAFTNSDEELALYDSAIIWRMEAERRVSDAS